MRSIYDFVPAPLARFEMNENAASTIVKDSSGNGHDGILNKNTSAAHVAGKINGAFEFDGIADFIEITHHADFTPALTPFSISAWVYMHDATNFILANKGVYNTDGEWALSVNSDDKLQFLLYDESVADCYIGRRYNTALTGYQNTWIHVAATYDGGAVAGGIKLYLNGVRVDDTDVTNGDFVAVENFENPVLIGKYDDSLFPEGLMDDVILFNNTELTARQVRKMADFRGKESIYDVRPNGIYNTNINNRIFGGVKEGCTV